MVYEFNERTIRVIIDQSQCLSCRTKACVKACSLYGRGILVVREGLPFLREKVNAEREGTECLACEEACRLRGFNVISIDAPISGLDKYGKSQRG